MRRQANLKDVVHPHHFDGNGLVDLYDHLIRRSDRGICGAARCRQVQPLFGHCHTFHQRYIHIRAGFLIHIHGQMGNMNVAVCHRAGIDGVAQVFVGLMGIAPGHQSRTHQCTVNLIPHGSADTDGQILCVSRFCQSQGHSLGIANAGKTTDANHHSGLYKLCRLLRGH